MGDILMTIARRHLAPRASYSHDRRFRCGAAARAENEAAVAPGGVALQPVDFRAITRDAPQRITGIEHQAGFRQQSLSF